MYLQALPRLLGTAVSSHGLHGKYGVGLLTSGDSRVKFSSAKGTFTACVVESTPEENMKLR